MTPPKKKTSWEEVDKWYDTLVGKEGHYYHQHLILPNVLRLLHLNKNPTLSLLDLGCGQGILARHLPKTVSYHGVDLSSSLLKAAESYKLSSSFTFSKNDICEPLGLKKKFSHATFILSLQNVERPDLAVKQAALHLEDKGTCLLVLNHPCFRIPRQSGWGIDEAQKIQYRKIHRYFSPLKIPIQMHPGSDKASEITWSFHFPLTAYSRFLSEAGFALTSMEEWVSDKVSTGARAKMENMARAEFPLFLCLVAQKL